MALSPLFSSRPQRVALGVAACVLGGIGFLPLFGGFTYEFALACGLVAPSACAIATALDTARTKPLPLEALRRGVVSGLGHIAVMMVLALGHGLRAGVCDFWSQFSLFALGPLPGVLLGGVWGALAGTALTAFPPLARSRTLLLLAALSAPVMCVVVSVLRYYYSPIIFAFDPFVGYFSGVLYDTELDGVKRLLSYRAGSAASLLAAFAFASLIARDADGHLRWQLKQRPLTLALALAATLGSLAIVAKGTALGHFQSAASIREALGKVAVSERCEVVYAAGLLKRDAHALARECDADVAALEQYFETQQRSRITVYLFASSAQKAKLMGARDVYIAKPWRHEIYIQASGYPHPVLMHELAHVVAGSFAVGPFKVAGPFSGLIPDPGRIEGFAEAAAPREGEDLSPREWAKAMRDLKLLPPLQSLFKLSFLGENASKAYTVSGAFIAWLKETYGAGPLRAWYSGQSLQQATQKDLPELEREFLAALDQVKLAPEVMAIARARFDRPGVFGRRCPHEVDQLNEDADNALGRLDPEEARSLYQRVLELDPTHTAARLGLGNCAFREGQLQAARQAFETLAADANLPALAQLHAQERAADSALAQGEIASANATYAALSSRIVDEDALRNLDVKRWIAPDMDETHPARRAIIALLIGDPELGSDWAVAGAELGRWSVAEPKLGFADYLLGKNYFQRGRWSDAASTLDRALDRELPLPRVRREALRTRLLVACALGQKARAQEVYSAYSKDPALNLPRRNAARRFAENCGLETR